ncbi:hypothetical protein DFH09DRAFT_1214777 [Mycena vulgaris]|nr:hypothetical protein DFH09DRAFT_1214777 [Mycena vulgaris]
MSGPARLLPNSSNPLLLHSTPRIFHSTLRTRTHCRRVHSLRRPRSAAAVISSIIILFSFFICLVVWLLLSAQRQTLVRDGGEGRRYVWRFIIIFAIDTGVCDSYIAGSGASTRGRDARAGSGRRTGPARGSGDADADDTGGGGRVSHERRSGSHEEAGLGLVLGVVFSGACTWMALALRGSARRRRAAAAARTTARTRTAARRVSARVTVTPGRMRRPRRAGAAGRTWACAGRMNIVQGSDEQRQRRGPETTSVKMEMCDEVYMWCDRCLPGLIRSSFHRLANGRDTRVPVCPHSSQIKVRLCTVINGLVAVDPPLVEGALELRGAANAYVADFRRGNV